MRNPCPCRDPRRVQSSARHKKSLESSYKYFIVKRGPAANTKLGVDSRQSLCSQTSRLDCWFSLGSMLKPGCCQDGPREREIFLNPFSLLNRSGSCHPRKLRWLRDYGSTTRTSFFLFSPSQIFTNLHVASQKSLTVTDTTLGGPIVRNGVLACWEPSVEGARPALQP